MPVRAPTFKPRRVAARRHDAVEQRRGTSAQRGYGYRWQKARAGYLAEHPLCAQCERDGRVTAATDLDHIIPHKGDMTLFWQRENWQGLCAPCHSRKTAREDGGFGNRGGVGQKFDNLPT